jgi:crossover junction endodeoxyribonuclease RuvC
MKILAIDPGYERLGIAVLEKTSKTKESLVYSECFRTLASAPFTERLVLIGNKIQQIIDEYSPTALSIENLFLNKNQKTVMRISEVRGAILYLAQKSGLEIRELTPLQIKLAVTGSGRSGKTEMIKMVKMILKSPQTDFSKKFLDDEFDAIAIGLAYFAYNKTLN